MNALTAAERKGLATQAARHGLVPDYAGFEQAKRDGFTIVHDIETLRRDLDAAKARALAKFKAARL